MPLPLEGGFTSTPKIKPLVARHQGFFVPGSYVGYLKSGVVVRAISCCLDG